MSDKPKFEVIDRRKMKAEEEEKEHKPAPAPAEAAPPEKATEETASGPRLVVPAEKAEELAEDLPAEVAAEEEQLPNLPPPPSAEESRQQKSAYDASAQRLEDLVRAQNPAMGAQPPVGFEHLVQQFYLSAMIAMGAGTQEGQRPRIDILGARQTIDLLAILAEKTKGNLTDAEDKMLQTVLFEARMAFLELSNMITLQGVQAPPPAKR
jgi:Domain of unknown function (DUF1844)